ncbi:hypothetical protein A2U01_0049128 [Trifolium medium]|uniref:Uncharacterized protein n=1 Tax=Trifolium medium TaxID=97028 RepID=A0A392QUF6_9FABA|nr:hypothetical protein [Trifolium medium]
MELVIVVVKCCGLDRILKHQGWVQSLQSLAFAGALVASHKANLGWRWSMVGLEKFSVKSLVIGDCSFGEELISSLWN